MASLTLPATILALRRFWNGELDDDIRWPVSRVCFVHTNEPKGRPPLENVCTEDVATAWSELRGISIDFASVVSQRYRLNKSVAEIAVYEEMTSDKVSEVIAYSLQFLSARIVELAHALPQK